MANIGATTAFYRVETALTRANNKVSDSMTRLATGKQNANAGDRSSYVAMGQTFKLDYIGTKAGMQNISVVKGYLDTATAVLDRASEVVAMMMEIAVVAKNSTNTTADATAMNLEYKTLGGELHGLIENSKYKNKDVFTASSSLTVDGRATSKSFGVASPVITGVMTNATTAANTTIQSSDATAALVTVQANINTARTTLGSQHAALSAQQDFLADMTANYEIGYNTVTDVNFSLETAILAKHQILQQASTAMLAQANAGQQGLLQLVQQ